MIGPSLSYADWFFFVVAQSLLYLLDEEVRLDVHFKVQEILAMLLHSTSDQICPYFDKFIHQLLNDIHKSPTDEAPRYFTLLSLFYHTFD